MFVSQLLVVNWLLIELFVGIVLFREFSAGLLGKILGVVLVRLSHVVASKS